MRFRNRSSERDRRFMHANANVLFSLEPRPGWKHRAHHPAACLGNGSGYFTATAGSKAEHQCCRFNIPSWRSITESMRSTCPISFVSSGFGFLKASDLVFSIHPAVFGSPLFTRLTNLLMQPHFPSSPPSLCICCRLHLLHPV